MWWSVWDGVFGRVALEVGASIDNFFLRSACKAVLSRYWYCHYFASIVVFLIRIYFLA